MLGQALMKANMESTSYPFLGALHLTKVEVQMVQTCTAEFWMMLCSQESSSALLQEMMALITMVCQEWVLRICRSL